MVDREIIKKWVVDKYYQSFIIQHTKIYFASSNPINISFAISNIMVRYYDSDSLIKKLYRDAQLDNILK